MKPYWIPYKMVNIGNQLYEKYRCNQCDGKCQVIISVSKEPPETCEEVKNGSRVKQKKDQSDFIHLS